MLPLSWLAPSRMWRHVSRMFAPLLARLALSPRKNVRSIQALAGGRIAGRTAREIQLETFAGHMEGSLQLFRGYRPGGWNPSIELSGHDAIKRGLAEGKGVILWISLFVSYSLTAKIALHRAGYAVSHLSGPTHGYPNTWIGRRLLNPIRTNIEDRYLRERVVLEWANTIPALRILKRRLEDNGIVSISVTQLAERPLRVGFLAGKIKIGGGAPTLARLTGAALLPVFPIQTGVNRFSVRVGPRIAVSTGIAPALAIERAVEDYAALLKSYVIEYPGQWLGWQGL